METSIERKRLPSLERPKKACLPADQRFITTHVLDFLSDHVVTLFNM